MPGFLINNINADSDLVNVINSNCIKSENNYNGYIVKRNTLNKFMEDKLFSIDENNFYITEGVILNIKELCLKYNEDSLIHLIKKLHKIKGIDFVNELRGCFSGAIYNKDLDEWSIYTNHYGDKTIYYYFNEGKFVIGSQFNYVVDCLKSKEIALTLDEQAVYSILTYGFMEDNSTYVREIKRLEPGSIITIKNSEIKISNYYSLTKNKYNTEKLTDSEIIDILDKKFRNAIRLEYDKDDEYNLRSLTDLSGGLDSRMGVWISDLLGYKNVLNITFCQGNYLDELIAKEIADYLNHELIVKPMNDALFMKDIEIMTRMLCGSTLYSGTTGCKRLLDCLNMSQFGLLHTGMLGDVIIGSYLKRPSELQDKSISGLYSVKLAERLTRKSSDDFSDKELYMLNVRGLYGMMTSNLVRQNYTETISPFMDVDFVDFCLSIPIEKRINHYIYKKWIIEKYPDAAKFKWEKIKDTITTPEWKIFFKRLIKRGPFKVLRLLKIKVPEKMRVDAQFTGMNPYDYWFKNKSDIRDCFTSYYMGNKSNPIISTKLGQDLETLFNKGNTCEKTQVLTVIAEIKNIWEL